MGCTNCGDSQNCGGCADACNPCGGPKTIISKQGLIGPQGPEGPINPNDRFSYYATSSSTIDIDALYITPAPINITIETYKAFLAGDFIRISDIPGISLANANYIEGTVTSYDETTGVLVVDGATNLAQVEGGLAYRKMIGTGSISSWYISLIDAKNINVSNESVLVYSARRDFTNGGTTYLNITSDNITNPAELAINKLVFDSADADVTVLVNKKNSHFGITDETIGLYDGRQVKAIEIQLHVPQEDGSNNWITPINVSGTDIYETGSIAVVKHGNFPDYSVNPMANGEIYTMASVPVGRDTGTISIKGTHRNYERQPVGASSGYFFKYINNTDLAVVGGNVPLTPGGTGEGFYSIKVYI